MRSAITILFVLFMFFCLVGSVYASYQGVGVSEVGRTTLSESSVRDGSTVGPRIIGGGPSSGK